MPKDRRSSSSSSSRWRYLYRAQGAERRTRAQHTVATQKRLKGGAAKIRGKDADARGCPPADFHRPSQQLFLAYLVAERNGEEGQRVSLSARVPDVRSVITRDFDSVYCLAEDITRE